jgi:hypothetical protein
VGEDIIKIGVSKDVLERLAELQRSFQGKYELLAVWPGEELLEDLVLDKLKPYRAPVGSSREHFNPQVTLDHVCNIVDHARDLYRTKRELMVDLDFEQRKRELELQEDLKDRVVKRRLQEAREKLEEVKMQEDLNDRVAKRKLLHMLVEEKHPEAIQVFLQQFSRP